MRLIDANRLLDMLQTNKFAAFCPLDEVISVVDACPTVDAVPVIRCMYCKYQLKSWHTDLRMKNKGYWLYGCERNPDPFASHTVEGYDDEYCSYGKRKEKAEVCD